MRTLKSAALAVCLLACSQPLLASTVIFRTDAELIGLSERVVHARAIGQRTALGLDGETIYTVTTLQVLEDFTGRVPDVIEVWELGGVFEDRFFYVGGAVEYRLGQEVVVCLERGPLGFRSVAMGFSKFDVVDAANGQRAMRRNVQDTFVVGGAADRAEVTLDSFRRLARQRTGRDSRRSAARALPVQEANVEANFTLLGNPGFRWRQVDQGTPISWYRNDTAPNPLLSGDAVAEIQTSLNAWTAPATSAIVLQYAGPTVQPTAKGPWSGLPATSGVITFEDPNNEISGSTLAIGGGSGTLGTGGTVNGMTFNAFSRAYVIFQNAADLSASFRQTLNFTRVLTHEIGHAIGFGHSETGSANLMHPSCCAGNTPVPPAIGPDDLAVLEFVYPGSAPACTYQLNQSSASFGSGGGAGSVTVTTGPGCGWTASSNAGFLSVTSGSSGTGSGTVGYSVTGNGTSARSGSLTVAGQTYTVSQTGSGPAMSLDRPALRFGAASNGATLVARTGAQSIRLSKSGAGTVTWTASTNRSWLQVSPASGSGAASLSISVGSTALPVGTHTATVSFAFNGAGTVPAPLTVTLVVMQNGTSANPFGVVDTPANNATGVTGAVPFTGWALDDTEVVNVNVCRAAVSPEAAGPDARCGGAAQIFVGSGAFIEGARPDVQTAFSNYPVAYRGGWGFMVLTNVLPNQGNGQFTFYAHAVDREGRTALIGTRTIACSNATATAPFGTIDTPGQGDTVSDANYANFGWVLSRVARADPPGGGAVEAFVDGVSVGFPCCWTSRGDITALFPSHPGVSTALGVLGIDTTGLSEGLHTIVWVATDNVGVSSGLGSRYFRMAPGAGAVTEGVEAALAAASVDSAPPDARAAPAVADPPLDRSPVVGRRGWSRDAPWRAYYVGGSGRAVMRGEEIDRFEIFLAAGGDRYTGHLRVGDQLAPLPVGSRLDASTGRFTWSPGVGFVGAYDLVFVRWSNGVPAGRTELRIILKAKGSGHVGTQVVIDVPGSQQDVGQPFMLAGWAADLDAQNGTGIDTLHVWAHPLAGGPPVFLGTPALGGRRPDVAAVHGEPFRDSGFGLVVQGLPPGHYDLAIYGWSSVAGGFAPPSVVRVTVR